MHTFAAQSRHHRIDFRHASVESYDRLNEEEDDSPIHLFPGAILKLQTPSDFL